MGMHKLTWNIVKIISLTTVIGFNRMWLWVPNKRTNIIRERESHKSVVRWSTTRANQTIQVKFCHEFRHGCDLALHTFINKIMRCDKIIHNKCAFTSVFRQLWTLHLQELNSSNKPRDTFNQCMAGKITLFDVCSNRWHHRLILIQVVINYRKKWGTGILLVLTRAFQLSTDNNTVYWWYLSSVRPVRGPVTRKFTGST